MPFGAVFGGLFFLLAGLLLIGPVRVLVDPFRVSQILFGVFALAVSTALWTRCSWARPLGIAAAAAFGVYLLTFGNGSLPTLVIALCGVVASILLAIPSTGRGSSSVAPVVPVAPVGTRRVEEAEAETEHGPAELRPTPPAPRRSPWLAVVTGSALILAVASLPVAWFVGAGARAGIQGLDWHEFGPGLERAALDGKPVLVDFFATWCGPCKAMDRNTFRDPRVVDLLNRDLVPVRIDAEGTEPVHGFVGSDLADRYGVVSYPTLVLMDAEGREIARSRGYRNADQLLAWLDAVLADGGEEAAAEPPEPLVL